MTFLIEFVQLKETQKRNKFPNLKHKAINYGFGSVVCWFSLVHLHKKIKIRITGSNRAHITINIGGVMESVKLSSDGNYKFRTKGRKWA